MPLSSIQTRSSSGCTVPICASDTPSTAATRGANGSSAVRAPSLVSSEWASFVRSRASEPASPAPYTAGQFRIGTRRGRAHRALLDAA
jgi:hypothetical protein